jgi:hypothetical protein
MKIIQLLIYSEMVTTRAIGTKILQGNTSLSTTFNGMNTTISGRKQDAFELAMQNTIPTCDSAQYILNITLNYNNESTS